MKIKINTNNIIKIYKLLYPYKWYILLDVLFFILMAALYLTAPESNSPLWMSDALHGIWIYTNRDTYMQSIKFDIIISSLLFLLATSNIRNHPKISKIIFLFPLYAGWIGLL